MSPQRTDFGTRDCGGALAAYALRSLDPDDVRTFRRHLASCAICRDELIAFQGVVDALAMCAPPRAVPAGLRDRVLGAAQEADRARVRSRASRARVRPTWRSAGGWRPAVAAALVLLVVAAGAVLASSPSSSSRVIRAQVSGGGSAQLRVSGGRGELVVRRLSPPAAGQIYEVWLKRSVGRPAPTSALFSVTAQGDGDVDVPGSLRGVKRVLVTPEPAGGSAVPTHAPVITADLS